MIKKNLKACNTHLGLNFGSLVVIGLTAEMV